MKSRTLRSMPDAKETLFKASATLGLATALTLLVQSAALPVQARNLDRAQLLTQKSDEVEDERSEAKSETKSKKEADKAKKSEAKAKKESDKGKQEKDEKAEAKRKDKESKAEAKAKAEAKSKDKDEKSEAKSKDKDQKTEVKESSDDKKSKKSEKDGDKDEDKKSARKKKGGWFGRGKNDSDDGVVEEEVIEVKEQEVKPEVKVATPTKAPVAVTKATDAGAQSVTEAPVLLPDTALISVLQDINKGLADLNETSGVETQDDKLILSLSRQVLDKALAGKDLNRILAPEFNSAAKTTMTTEAWASGDIQVSDKLRGSVATVWGKRINGLLNVTIAGECQDKTLSNGEKVGEFIVVIQGRSPVKSGFDIQSQADVSYWIGTINGVSIDAAYQRLKEKTAEGEDAEESSEATSPEKSGENKTEDVKKKSLIILESILTKRGREYLAVLQKYQEQQQALIAQKQAEAALAEAEEDITADDTVPAKLASKQLSDEQFERDLRRARAERNDDDDFDAYGDERRSRRRFEPVDERRADSRRGEERRDDARADARRDDAGADARRDDARADARRDDNRGDDMARRSNGVRDEERTGERRGESSNRRFDSDRTNERRWDEKRDEKTASTKADNGDRSSDRAGDRSVADNNRRWDNDELRADKQRAEQRNDSSKDEQRRVPEQIVKRAEQELFTPRRDVNTIDLPRISMVPGPASASSNQGWESPAIAAISRQPSLGASLMMPDRAIAGRFLTVSVVNKDRQPERSVELSFNGATLSTDPQGQALFMVPDDATPGRSLHISMSARPELSPGIVDILQPLGDGDDQKHPQIDKVSRLVASDGVLTVDGHDFDGLANRNRIMIDNEHEATVIAASPVQLRVLLPKNLVTGTHTVNLNGHSNSADLRSNPAKFDYIRAQIEQPDLRKTKGVLNKLVVRVAGTKSPVPVRIVNRTPDVIKFSRGDNLLVTTSGGTDNSYTVAIKQLKKGDYKVDTSIEI